MEVGSMHRSITSLCVVVPLLVAGHTAAQPGALGPVFEVNSYTIGSQFGPKVATDGGGNFVVVWDGSGPGGQGVFARLFDSAGSASGEEFQVNATTTGRQGGPVVSRRASGDFVVAWEANDAASYGISARLFDASGTPLGPEFPVNTYTTDRQLFASVGMDATGNFVVAWVSFYGQDGDGYGIFGQRFDASGSPVGSEFPINTYTTGKQHFPSVAMRSTGEFVVAWDSPQDDPAAGNSAGVFARRFDASGTPEGGEFQVNTYTTNFQGAPHIAMDASGNFVVTWISYEQDGQYYGVYAQRFTSAGAPDGSEFRASTQTAGNETGGWVSMDGEGRFVIDWHGGSGVFARRYDASGAPVGETISVEDGSFQSSFAFGPNGVFTIVWVECELLPAGCLSNDAHLFGRQGGFLDVASLKVDETPSGGVSNQNGILEPGERVVIDPGYGNPTADGLPLSGAASNLHAAAGGTYTIDDATADYGTIAAGGVNDCIGATNDCFEVTVAGPRPTTHWDAVLDETLSTGLKRTWTLHVGESFADVPSSAPFYPFIESVLHNEITAGCSGGNYCPAASVTRGQMAVFLLKSEHGADYIPPACAGTFPDVPCPSLFADWIEQLAAEGVTAGCGGGLYCPESAVTRKQMAVFLLKTKEGAGYTPPQANGVFDDVPATDGFAAWIEELYARQITGGCQASPLLYCPDIANTRGQMAVFLVKTFLLRLYGP
jgi:hypothetical protein